METKKSRRHLHDACGCLFLLNHIAVKVAKFDHFSLFLLYVDASPHVEPVVEVFTLAYILANAQRGVRSLARLRVVGQRAPLTVTPGVMPCLCHFSCVLLPQSPLGTDAQIDVGLVIDDAIACTRLYAYAQAWRCYALGDYCLSDCAG